MQPLNPMTGAAYVLGESDPRLGILLSNKH